jgi:6-phosphogluconate dehydrogenase (decarboxylating)
MSNDNYLTDEELREVLDAIESGQDIAVVAEALEEKYGEEEATDRVVNSLRDELGEYVGMINTGGLDFDDNNET